MKLTWILSYYQLFTTDPIKVMRHFLAENLLKIDSFIHDIMSVIAI